MRLNLQVSDYR